MIDWDQFRIDLNEVIADNPTTIVLRRGTATIAAQTVRVERAGFIARELRSPGGIQSQMGIVIMGDLGLNIQLKDRFTLAGILYEVTFVRPNQRSVVMAEATAIE